MGRSDGKMDLQSFTNWRLLLELLRPTLKLVNMQFVNIKCSRIDELNSISIYWTHFFVAKLLLQLKFIGWLNYFICKITATFCAFLTRTIEYSFNVSISWIHFNKWNYEMNGVFVTVLKCNLNVDTRLKGTESYEFGDLPQSIRRLLPTFWKFRMLKHKS